MNRRETVELLKVLADNYTNHKIADPEGTVKIWEMNLSPYKAEDIYKAAKLHMARCSYIPNPADLIKLITRAQIVYTPPRLQIEAENATERETGCSVCPYEDCCLGIKCIV